MSDEPLSTHAFSFNVRRPYSTALAHLRAVILYIVDASEQCGYSIKQQAELFHSIKPLFANKPLCIAVNKVRL